jgi:hypothetical protein
MSWRVLAVLAMAGLLWAQPGKIPLATFRGTVHGVSNKQLTIENEEGNLVDFEINRKTHVSRGNKQISPSELATGDSVTIEARQEMSRFLVAVNITAQPKSD